MEKKLKQTTVVVRGEKRMRVTIYQGRIGKIVYYRARANCGETSCGRTHFNSQSQLTVDGAVKRVTDIANNHIKGRHNDFK